MLVRRASVPGMRLLTLLLLLMLLPPMMGSSTVHAQAADVGRRAREFDEASVRARQLIAGGNDGTAAAAVGRLGELLTLLGAPAIDAALREAEAALPAAKRKPLDAAASTLATALRGLIRERLGSAAGSSGADCVVEQNAAPTPQGWVLLGPFEGSDASAFGRDSTFERSVAAARPGLGRDGAITPQLLGDGPAALRELQAHLGPGDGAVVLLERWLQVERPTTLRLRLGALGPATLRVGAEVALRLAATTAPRPLAARVEREVTLPAGRHRLLLKLADVRGALAADLDWAVVRGAPPLAIARPAKVEAAVKPIFAPLLPPPWLNRWLAAEGKAAQAADAALAALVRLDWPFESYGEPVAEQVRSRLERAAARGASAATLALAEQKGEPADRRARCEAALAAEGQQERSSLQRCVVETLEPGPADARWRASLAGDEDRSVASRLLRVDLWLRLGGDDAAWKLTRDAVPELGPAVALHELQGRLCAARDDLHGAARALGAAAALEPGHAQRQLAWLVAVGNAGDLGALRKAVGVVRARTGDPAAGALIWARALHDAGDHAAAAAALAAAPAGLLATVELRAKIAEARGDRATAEAALREAVRRAPARRDLRARLERLQPTQAASDVAGEDLLQRASRLTEAPIPSAAMTTALRKIRVHEQAAGRGQRYEGEIFVVGKDGPRSHRIELDYVPGQATVEVLRAQILRRDGSSVRAVDTGLDRIAEAGTGLYYDLEERWLAFRDLEAGDVLIVETLQRDIAPDPFRLVYGEVFLLGDDHPVRALEIEVRLRSGAPLHHAVSVATGFEVQRGKAEDGGPWLRLLGRDLPAAKVEDDGPGASALVPTLHVSGFASWATVATWWSGLLRQSLPAPGSDPTLAALATRLTAGAEDEEAKIARLYRFVADEIRYVGLEFGVHSLRPYPATEVLARRFGDCKDKATLLVGLLAAVGIEAEVTLVRTRHAGGIAESILRGGEGASVALFDHAIVALVKGGRFLDPTARHHGPYELPDGDHGGLALRVPWNGKAEGRALVTLPWPQPDGNEREELLHLELQPDGSAALAFTLRLAGHAAAQARERLAAEATQQERLTEDLSRRYPGLVVGEIEVLGAEAPLGPSTLTIRLRGELPGACSPAADGSLRCAPLAPRTSWRARLAPQQPRTTRRLLGPPESVRSRAVLVPPKGWRVLQLPSPLSRNAPALGLGANLTVDAPRPGTAAIDLRLRRERAWQQPTELAATRAFADAVDAALQQSVVLVREAP